MALRSVESALQIFRDSVRPLGEVERVSVINALGKVLAEDVRSTVNVPPENCSSMDGYALNTDDLTPGQKTTLTISQRVMAGHQGEPLESGTAVRIFTGGQVPPGANAVVMQEECEIEGDSVTFPADVPAGNNVRPQGQDIQKGSQVLIKGQKLLPQHLGLLASVGIAEVAIYRPLKIIMMSTGDELVDPGNELAPGQIYNSNRFMLAGMIQQLGWEFIDGGIIPDDYELTKNKLAKAAEEADVVITSGGISVGDADFVKPAVSELGQLDMWKLAIKPGKPLAYGHIKDTPFFGLPGNPVSSFVTFLILVKPYLQTMQGMPWTKPRSWQLPANFERNGKGIRQEYLRVKLVKNENGEPCLESFHNQDSGVLRSTVFSEALAIVPPNTPVKRGDKVETLLLDELLNN